MVEVIKNKIWDLLKEKQVSLAMLYDKKGNIAWSKGRTITGRSVFNGQGFSKTYIKKSLTANKTIRAENEVIVESRDMHSQNERPPSVFFWNINSLIILPVADTYFLYVDSGTKEAFNDKDFERFKTLGELLGDTVKKIREHQQHAGGFIGSSEKTKEIRDSITSYALVNEPVLLKGETGTGKSYIAELLHRYSGRPGQFKVINTPAIPENLFEIEMFGHTRGAFTDARQDKPGLIAEAEKGTLFIDEITEIPMSLQAKLLRFVETKAYQVLGESGERKADVRIVAATNRDLHEAIRKKHFRADLYYRLNVLEIQLPPLRERKEDLKDLVFEKRNFLNEKQIGDGFWEAVYRYHWPGNIRELITVLKRVGLEDKEVIEGDDVQRIIDICSAGATAPQTTSSSAGGGTGQNGVNEKTERIKTELSGGKSFWEAVKEPFLDRDLNREEVKNILEWGLQQTGGKYKGLCKLFNFPEEEYKNFMSFLYSNRLK